MVFCFKNFVIVNDHHLIYCRFLKIVYIWSLSAKKMEENIKERAVEQSKEAVKQEAKGFIDSLKTFLRELLDFRHDTDHQATMDAIRGDIPFKGATAWILIFAVFVASIGLNANSTAVVIGAMLISPLMGPILGIGMAFAVNDIDTFKKSATSLLTMLVLSLLTSFIFFYVFPGGIEDTSELIARTRPDIRDVLIAFFGGLALMVARTKKGTIASVIFGVAIATALMPPLCTVGFGLAKWVSGESVGFSYALGAMYLFTINTIFIALATFIVLKLLSFPMHKYANAAKRKQYTMIATIVGLIVMVPAVYAFMSALGDARVKNQINRFVKNEIEPISNYQLIDKEYDEATKTLSLNFFNEMTEADRRTLKNQWDNDPRYNYLSDVVFKIKGSNTKSFDLITSAYKEKTQELQESKNIIAGLQKQIEELQNTISGLNQRIEEANPNSVGFSTIAKDAKIRYNDIQEIGFAKELSSKDFIKIDTTKVVTIKWNKALADSVLVKKEAELQAWLQAEMKLDTLFMKRKK